MIKVYYTTTVKRVAFIDACDEVTIRDYMEEEELSITEAIIELDDMGEICLKDDSKDLKTLNLYITEIEEK